MKIIIFLSLNLEGFRVLISPARTFQITKLPSLRKLPKRRTMISFSVSAAAAEGVAGLEQSLGPATGTGDREEGARRTRIAGI